MNRNDRSKLMMKTRTFTEDVSKLCTEYAEFLSELQSCEEDKLSSVPEAFENSSLCDNLSAGIESIEQASNTVEEISNLISEIPDILNVRMRKAAKKCSLLTQPTVKINPAILLNEKRTERIQIVVTPSLNKFLRNVSESRKISMNEIINALLASNLQDISDNV